VPRAKVASTLWLDGTDERGGANLWSALWRQIDDATGLAIE
jgi:hypothetical protein